VGRHFPRFAPIQQYRFNIAIKYTDLSLRQNSLIFPQCVTCYDPICLLRPWFQHLSERLPFVGFNQRFYQKEMNPYGDPSCALMVCIISGVTRNVKHEQNRLMWCFKPRIYLSKFGIRRFTYGVTPCSLVDTFLRKRKWSNEKCSQCRQNVSVPVQGVTSRSRRSSNRAPPDCMLQDVQYIYKLYVRMTVHLW